MKKLLLLLPLALMMSFSVSDGTLTKKERRFAKDHLKETSKESIKTVNGLSAAQLSFKPDSARWSVEDCLKHIAMAEMGIWKTIQDGLSQPANPEKRAEIKATDQQLLPQCQDRSSKIQARKHCSRKIPRLNLPQEHSLHLRKTVLSSSAILI